MRDELKLVASNYLQATFEPFTSHNLARHVRDEIPVEVRNRLPATYDDLLIKGSTGQGVWAAIPWIAFFDPLITNSATNGFYVVYLYSADMKELHLSLNQGTTAVYHEFGPRYGRQILQARASLMFNRVEKQAKNRMTRVINLESQGALALGYEAGHAVGYTYNLEDLPSDEEMLADLEDVLSLYRHLIFRGGITPSEALLETGGAKDIEEAHRYQLVRRLERNPSVRKKVLASKPAKCEGCDLSPTTDYVLPTDRLPLDVHHLTPISELKDGERLVYEIPEDFAVLCPTCHRVAHQMDDPGDVQALKDAVRFKHARLIM